MKTKSIAVFYLAVLFALCAQAQEYKMYTVEAPFDMPVIYEYVHPSIEFNIVDYGASPENICTDAIARAIDACNAAGGGKIVIPKGEWLTGAIKLKSNVCLYLQDGAVLLFTDNPAYYLPAVPTTWEGMECYNYSPLIYAYECENISIAGHGTIKPKMDLWRTWFGRPQAHRDALVELYTKASTYVPVEDRQMAVNQNNMRPHLIQFNRCKNIVLDGFKIRESPFWTIHMYLCENGIARNLDVYAHGHNNDGIDLEMTRNFLVEDCTFDQGDDAVVIKSGRNQDAWRLHSPSENIVIRNCVINAGHTLLGIGSEISGGVNNVYMHDCQVPVMVHRLFFVKTNHRRGAKLTNIYMKNIKAKSSINVLEIDTDVLYQWRTLVPTYEEALTRISGIHLENINIDAVKQIYSLKGDPRLPINTVSIKDVSVGTVANADNTCENVQWLTIQNVGYDKVDPKALPELNSYINNK